VLGVQVSVARGQGSEDQKVRREELESSKEERGKRQDERRGKKVRRLEADQSSINNHKLSIQKL